MMHRRGASYCASWAKPSGRSIYSWIVRTRETKRGSGVGSELHSRGSSQEQPSQCVGITTNALESVNARVRKVIKTRGHFSSDEAASKLIWLALRNITAQWSRAAHDWKIAMNQFAILYQDRFTLPQA
jgi:putative transposase